MIGQFGGGCKLESALDELEQIWGEKYPIVIKSWRSKWEYLSAYFRYPGPIRKVIYTTNSIEAVHRQFRKLTKTKDGFPNDKSLLKLFYLGIQNASKKWTMPIQNWDLTLSQLAIFFIYVAASKAARCRKSLGLRFPSHTF